MINRLAKFKLALSYSKAALDKIRSRVHCGLRISPLIKKGVLTAPGPITVSINLTHLCNLRCRMCGQWRRKDVYRKEILPLEKLKELVDDVAQFHPKIYLWGGEPLLYPHFSELVRYLKEKKQYTIINTNGVLLKKYAAEMVDLRVDGLDISIDGPPEIHNEIRGVPRTFEKVIEGLKILGEHRRIPGQRRPMIKAISTISETNQDFLDETLEMLESTHLFDAAIFNLGWFTTEKIGVATDRIFRKYLGCGSSSWNDFVGALGEVDSEKVASFMTRISSHGRKGTLPVFFIPSITPKEVEEYYCRPSSFMGRKACLSPWISLEIRPDGNVTFCPDFPDYIIGNIKEDSFFEIWNGEKARKFRGLLVKKGLFPLCSRCCGLYVG